MNSHEGPRVHVPLDDPRLRQNPDLWTAHPYDDSAQIHNLDFVDLVDMNDFFVQEIVSSMYQIRELRRIQPEAPEFTMFHAFIIQERMREVERQTLVNDLRRRVREASSKPVPFASS